MRSGSSSEDKPDWMLRLSALDGMASGIASKEDAVMVRFSKGGGAICVCDVVSVL